MPTLLEEKSPTKLRKEPNQLGDLPATARRPSAVSRVETLIQWSTSSGSMDREAMENVDRDGWGIER